MEVIMEISVIDKRSYVILELTGSLTLDSSVNLKTECLKQLRSHNKIILDLSNVNFIDSSGIGAIALIHSRVSELAGRLLISNVSKDISLVFSITRAFELFDFYDSVENAEFKMVGLA
jgi:anti-sigma B factor antagonist